MRNHKICRVFSLAVSVRVSALPAMESAYFISIISIICPCVVNFSHVWFLKTFGVNDIFVQVGYADIYADIVTYGIAIASVKKRLLLFR